MKKLLASTAVLALSATAASAADLYSPPIVEAPAYVAEAFSWTGLYVGAHGGWGWSTNSSASYVDDEANDTCGFNELAGCALALDPEGAFGGAQIGYQMQWGQFVLGVEGDYSFASLKDEGNGYFDGGSEGTHVDLEVKQMATIMARFGWAWGQWLPFATVGYGWAEGERKAFNPNAPGGGLDTSDKQWHDGLTLGAGLEYAINNHWSVKGEYRWFNGSEETYGVGYGGGTDVDMDIHTVRVGVNYRF